MTALPRKSKKPSCITSSYGKNATNWRMTATCPHANDSSFYKHSVAVRLTWLAGITDFDKVDEEPQTDSWQNICDYLSALRDQYKAKRNFIALLDTLMSKNANSPLLFIRAISLFENASCRF